MTFLVGERVRVIETGELGKVISTEYGTVEVALDSVPWEIEFSETDLVGMPEFREIIQALVFSGNGGLVWHSADGVEDAVAYAWSDGVVTWQRWRD